MIERFPQGRDLDRGLYELEFEDDFDDERLDLGKWFPYYLPHWSSRAQTAARYSIADGCLTLRIDPDQAELAPEYTGPLRASNVQTGAFAGSVGSTIGQHRFRSDLVVREAQPDLALYLPRFGLVETRVRMELDAHSMAALWLIGYEDQPERSAELCVFEVFGRDVAPGATTVGMGLHPFGDPSVIDDFVKVKASIDVSEFHDFAVEWMPGGARFFVDGVLVHSAKQAPDYPLQLMLDVFDFTGDRPVPASAAPRLIVDAVRGYRRTNTLTVS